MGNLKRVKVLIDGKKNNAAVKILMRQLYLANPFRDYSSKTDPFWYNKYFPALDAYALSVKDNTRLTLLGWNPTIREWEPFADRVAIQSLAKSYISCPLWIKAKYASSTYDKRRADDIAHTWGYSHRWINRIYVMRWMVQFS